MSKPKCELGFPRWLAKLMYDDPMVTTHGRTLFGVDHPAHIGPIAIYEPYGIEDRHLCELLAFCSRHDLRMSIHGQGQHCLATIRIVIWRKEDHTRLATAAPVWYPREPLEDTLAKAC